MVPQIKMRFSWLGAMLFVFMVMGIFSTVALADKRTDLKGMRGVTYSATPTDYTGSGAGTYYDSDFCNEDFRALWGKDSSGVGREDVKNIGQTLDARYIRLYDWNTPQARNHKGFLDECNKYGVQVLVPISNYFVGLYDQGQGNDADGFIKEIIGELVSYGKFHPAVAMITVGNEPELNNKSTDAVVKAIEAVVKAQEQLGISETDMMPIAVPEDFGTYGEPSKPGIVRLQTVRNAISTSTYLSGKNFLSTLYVAAMQTSNPGSDVSKWLNETFPAAFPDDYVIITELGRDDITAGGLNEQAVFDKAAWEAVMGSSNDKALGACIFSFTNQNWKTGTEAAYGMNTKTFGGTVAQTTTGLSYRVDTLTPKPVYNTFQDLWTGFAEPALSFEAIPSGAPAEVGAGTSAYRVYLSVYGQSAVGTNAEWYLLHITPLGEVYQYEMGGNWVLVDEITHSASFPIFTLNKGIIYEGELATGTHIFMLAIDPIVNGIKDEDHWEVEVEVIEVN
ncbi:MAG: hypothetical protein U5R49_21555 [Deltaproteobacteria bacterium]|nr:hypothetical protein [Deltaproteobacteria bacterium]